MNVGTYELANGRMLHIEQKGGGACYACQVYDHSPFCRLCQPVDEILDGCLQNVIDGNMEARQNGNGEFSFKLTPQGQQQASHIVRRIVEDDDAD